MICLEGSVYFADQLRNVFFYTSVPVEEVLLVNEGTIFSLGTTRQERRHTIQGKIRLSLTAEISLSFAVSLGWARYSCRAP